MTVRTHVSPYPLWLAGGPSSPPPPLTALGRPLPSSPPREPGIVQPLGVAPPVPRSRVVQCSSSLPSPPLCDPRAWVAWGAVGSSQVRGVLRRAYRPWGTFAWLPVLACEHSCCRPLRPCSCRQDSCVRWVKACPRLRGQAPTLRPKEWPAVPRATAIGLPPTAGDALAGPVLLRAALPAPSVVLRHEQLTA